MRGKVARLVAHECYKYTRGESEREGEREREELRLLGKAMCTHAFSLVNLGDKPMYEHGLLSTPVDPSSAAA